METSELIEHAKRIRNSPGVTATKEYAEALAFLSTYAGPKSSFVETLKLGPPGTLYHGALAEHTASVMDAFISYLEAGLHEDLPPERRAQLDVVSDFLEQAEALLESKDVHPAAPAMLIGATLEEFLRTWVESEGLNMEGKKPSLDTYAKVLRAESIITKQDFKDINSWGGTRNHAAHGEWKEVGNRQRVALMLEAVNLFMRTHREKWGAHR